jgi:hypothetical protein
MPGYYETYLHGLNQAIPMARLAESERRNDFNEQYRNRALMAQEAQRMQNQRRLEAAMEEAARHHRSTEDTTNQQLKLMMMRLEQQMNQGNFQLKEDSQGNQWAYDAKNNKMVPVGTGGAPGAGNAPTGNFRAPKALPSKERENLSGIADDYHALVALAKSFKSNYAGAPLPVLGELQNMIGRYGPESTGLGPQAEWWKMQEKLSNLPERHKIMGGSVTQTEVPLWEKGAINPALRPEEIVKMLNVRTALMNRALQRRSKSASNSYNRREVEAATSIPVPGTISNELPDLEGLARMGSRITGQGRPPLDQLLQDQQ